MIIAVVAGGTGGHFYPGFSVAQELKKKGHEVYFIVRNQDYVLPLLQKDGIPVKCISAGGFNRRFDWRLVLTLCKLFKGFLQSLFIFLGNRPSAVLAMGGYLSFPPTLAARLLGIPVFLHEQNVIPGLANRILSRFSKKIFVSFDGSRVVFGKKAILSGNPVRPEFGALPTAGEARKKFGLNSDKKVVLIFGGSLGARRLNDLTLEAFGKMSRLAEHWQILHVTGELNLDKVREAYRPLPFSTFVTSYCHNMGEAYAASDFIVSRAGASTISELMVVKKPALLIPYPLATAGHQTANARVLADAGCCALLEERDLKGSEFGEALKSFLEDENRLRAARQAYDHLTHNPMDAAARIAGEIEKFLQL